MTSTKRISYWLDVPYEARPSLEGEIEADVVVIGGGITGVSVAYHSAKLGFKVVLIEKKEIASGSAGKNGGMIVEGLSCDFIEAEDEFGSDVARDAWNKTIEAAACSKRLIKEIGIDCGFTEGGSVYIGLSDDDDAWLGRELEARKQNALKTDFLPRKHQFASTSFHGSIFNPSDACVDPVRFIRGLARRAESMGALIFENTRAVKYDSKSVTTGNGKVSARHVVLAIESHTPETADSCEIIDSLGLMTEPLSQETLEKLEWHTGEMLWTTGTQYICIRKVGNRLFLNGEDETTLLEQVFNYFPKLEKGDLAISHRWNGPIMYPTALRPIIETRNGVHRVFGQGGNGLTNGIMSGKVLAESFVGKEIPALYRVIK